MFKAAAAAAASADDDVVAAAADNDAAADATVKLLALSTVVIQLKCIQLVELKVPSTSKELM